MIHPICILLVFALAGSIASTRAQSPAPGQPVIHAAPSFKKPASTNAIPKRVAPLKRAVPNAPHQRSVALPPLPSEFIDELKVQDALEVTRRLRIGIGRQLDEPIIVSPANTPSFTWTILPNGWRVWSLEITSQDALGLRLGLEGVHLPPGARLIVYDPANENVQAAPVTAESLGSETNLWTETVFAQTAVLECQAAPDADLSAINFSVDSLSHFYRSLFVPIPKSSGCEKDVACAPAWLDDAAGVARIDFVDSGSAYLCTGCLLNDTVTGTVIDYFLTANHCVGNQTVASTLEALWFYQASTCGGTPPDEGTVPLTVGGAAFLNGSDQNDFTLLRLHEAPPDGVTYLGWTTAQPSSETLTCIQHPQGNEKKISFGHKSLPLPDYPDFIPVHWSDGVTEEGSSGSPLLNSSHQVIGQLYGGSSACDNRSGLDIFGRFDLSYQMIQPWIDPDSLVDTLFPRAKGTYSGLFSAGAPTVENAGFCTLTLATKGSYTGSIQLAGKRYAFKGTFHLTDSDSSVSRVGNTPLSLHFTLDASGNFDHLTGTISDGTWTASLSARRPVFNAQNPAPFAGSYTIVIPGISGSQTAPQGNGFGTLKIDSNGKAKFIGSLADGTPLTQTVAISQDGDWPLFGSLYKGLGLLWSHLTVDTTRPSDDIHGLLTWIKSPQNATYYPNGFTSQLNCTGSLYVKPTAGTRIINLSDATVTFAGGNLNSSFANSINIGTDNKVVNQGANKLTLTFTSATGLFKGAATSPDGENVSFKGAAFQKVNKAYGFFLGADQSGSVIVGP